MLGPLIAIFVGVWFYRSANRISLPPLKWGAIGALSFWCTEFILNMLFLKIFGPYSSSDVMIKIVISFALSFGGAFLIIFIIKNKYLDSKPGSKYSKNKT